MWQRCIGNPPFFWREIILVTSNGLKIRKEHERRGEEILERCRGRRRREHFHEISIKLREIELETKDLFTTVSFQVMFPFLIYASHIL